MQTVRTLALRDDEVGDKLHKAFDFTRNPSDSSRHDADQAGRPALPRVSRSPGL